MYEKCYSFPYSLSSACNPRQQISLLISVESAFADCGELDFFRVTRTHKKIRATPPYSTEGCGNVDPKTASQIKVE
jgi:hypothetical protein